MVKNEYSRYDVLLSQFQHDLHIDEKMQQSLDRIRIFLYNSTSIHYLIFIKQEILIHYLEYHCSHNFKTVSFVQAVEDIKNFLFFLKSKKEINEVPKVDLSLQNLSLWMNLSQDNEQLDPSNLKFH